MEGLSTPSSRGFRSSTRGLLRRRRGDIGLQLTRVLAQYKPGDKVVFDINPSVHKGMPHRRYHGMMGVILEKRGRAYAVETTVGSAKKTVIARPEHIKPA
ncbi:MAG: 50S ribosomal protein L21e [Candidatus Bathyarchaeia archaeon]